ncbi:Ig-like domain-containing protein, partial [Kitasatospora cinereorecta]|uniref:Ig-like domain-containing protein n=1 Tax=Kitasatospora cinereorecta TaxID=285560 RepID=UPI0031F9948C
IDPAGAAGGQGGGPDGSGVAGGGGSQSAPGTGSPNSALGGPGGAGSGIDQWTGLPEPGSGGTGGNGARGGNGGRGGGGGWCGGGVGSGGGNPGNLYGAGGGGGSGYAAPGTADAVLLQGVHHGDGRAVVSFRYDTGVDVTADTDRPLFGHPVTLTAAVVPAAPVGTPGGTVTFLDGADELATVPLAGGRAAFTTAALRPGAHAITARYGGDALFTPSTTAEPAAPTVGFSAPCTTGVHRGPLTVDPGEALCLAPGARQEGPVTVRAGGALAVTGASVTGPLTADGALAVRICGGDLTGPLTLRRTVGAVQSGPAGDPADCAGSTVHGPVTAEDNTGGVVFSALRVTGPLRCAGNVPAPVLVAAVVDGPRSGQCR